jgi:hypothetical protein
MTKKGENGRIAPTGGANAKNEKTPIKTLF